MTDKEQMELDEAVRTFAGYVRGDNGFDELDFKEWLLDWRDKAVRNARLDELERIDKANTGNEINFWFKEAQDAGLNNGWRTMRQYTQERTKALQSSQRPAEKEG